MIATTPLPIVDGVDVGAHGAGELLGADALGARLAQLGKRGDLEHALGDVGLEAGEQPPGERVASTAPTSVKISVWRQSGIGRHPR